VADCLEAVTPLASLNPPDIERIVEAGGHQSIPAIVTAEQRNRGARVVGNVH